MSGLIVTLVPCGSSEHLEDLKELRARGFALPHQYSSWPQSAHPRRWRWVRLLEPDGKLIGGFALELLPSRRLPGFYIGRIDRLGRDLHVAALPRLGVALQQLADTVPRLLRLDVRLFDEQTDRRARYYEALVASGAAVAQRKREYDCTLVLDLEATSKNLMDRFSSRMRQDIRQFTEGDELHISEILEARYAKRLRALHAETFARTGGDPPNVDFGGVLVDVTHGESVLLGAFVSRQESPESLVSFIWGRLHGDHAVYEIGALEKSARTQKLSPGYGLLWRLAAWARDKGAAWLDLGGVIPESRPETDPLYGIATFKRRFSGDERRVADELVFVPGTLAGRASNRYRSGRGRRSPLPAACRFRHAVVTETEPFHALATSWQDLAERSGQDAMSLAHGWMLAWWSCFGQQRQLNIHCFYAGERLVAIAPMLIERSRYRGVPVTVQVAMANGHSPFFDLLLDPSLDAADVQTIIVSIVLQEGVELTRFARLPESSRLAGLVRDAAATRGLPVGHMRQFRTPLVRFDTSWDEFFGARSKKFRKNMRNKVNRFESAEGYTIERHELVSADDRVIDDLVEVSRHSWKRGIGTDLASVPASRAFLEALIRWLGPAGGTSVWIARETGRPIAYEFHASYAGVSYPLRADFDERCRDIAPGSVVEYFALKYLFETGRHELYDSCADDYWYLSNWTENYRSHVDIEVFSRGFLPGVLYWFEYRLMPLWRRIRRSMQREKT